ncbi:MULTISPECIES: GntR family transcriptional regulator [unclassified Rhizobium]|uniref:GntR family transcriptional regulator n=1 Tax=unclassified Rhizobium TaxID=2613769 RepID=UPI001ADB3A3F|nr:MULTISPECIES: GntR family transcriptional regulator [unclassified Rhizobium]MBO9099633.1 GntR family transcriptional regulator [Rhizobium sp. L58/93]QXZ86897.1 GntR family transcriptional regulator [Rhizobium sp. K1/93]QXZ93069.1 GntR family transcriptional regulator [Rhizobium sp. K15/93]
MTVSAQPMKVVRPDKTLRELSLEKMREAIVNLHFRPGERLIERDLCEQLGVSRTIVREVLRHLESEGLVSILPNRGPIVAETTAEEARQIYEIRGVLEGIAAKACAEKADPAVALLLEGILGRIRASYASNNLPDVLEATGEFYRILFEQSGRLIAWGIVKSITVRINHLRSMTIKTAGRDKDGPEQMQRIVDAIRQGDGDAANRAANSHVGSASAIAQELLANPEASEA